MTNELKKGKEKKNWIYFDLKPISKSKNQNFQISERSLIFQLSSFFVFNFNLENEKPNYLNKYRMKIVTRSHYAITINK